MCHQSHFRNNLPLHLLINSIPLPSAKSISPLPAVQSLSWASPLQFLNIKDRHVFNFCSTIWTFHRSMLSPVPTRRGHQVSSRERMMQNIYMKLVESHYCCHYVLHINCLRFVTTASIDPCSNQWAWACLQIRCDRKFCLIAGVHTTWSHV